MIDIKKMVAHFFSKVAKNDIEIYNEFSLQHELGIFLREELPDYKIQFERNVSFFTYDTNTIKKEIDISIFNEDKSEMFAIELKHPLNGQHPEQMYSFAKDIKFMEELKDRGFQKTAFLALVRDKPFYTGQKNTGIYKYFRNEYALYGDIYKPTGALKNKEFIPLSRKHEFEWIENKDGSKYFVVEID